MDPIWTNLHNNTISKKDRTLQKIEIHAADHCVQKCHHCSHAADIAPRKNYTPDDFQPHFQNLQDHGIHWKEINILGGEPFLCPDLAELTKMCKKYGNTIGIMSNMYWLREEASVEEHREVLTNADALYYTLYHTLLEKNGGLHRVKELIGIIRKTYPHLAVRPLGQAGPITSFAKVEFHDDPKPIINQSCHFRKCKQLLSNGQILGCCAALRIPGWPEIDQYDITGKFNVREFINWYRKPILNLCSHCCIATEGVTPTPWTIVQSPPAPTPQDPDEQDHTPT
jgi:hypothetical protein